MKPNNKMLYLWWSIEKHKSNWNTITDGILQDMFTSFTKETTEYLFLIVVDLIQG